MMAENNNNTANDSLVIKVRLKTLLDDNLGDIKKAMEAYVKKAAEYADKNKIPIKGQFETKAFDDLKKQIKSLDSNSLNKIFDNKDSHNDLIKLLKDLDNVKSKLTQLQPEGFNGVNALKKPTKEIQKYIDLQNSLNNQLNEAILKMVNSNFDKLLQSRNVGGNTSKPNGEYASEKKEIEQVTQAIETLKSSINSKTEAIVREEMQMRQSAAKEVSSLLAVVEAVKKVENSLNGISNFNIPGIDDFKAKLESIKDIKLPKLVTNESESSDKNKSKNNIAQTADSIDKISKSASELETVSQTLNQISQSLSVIDTCINVPDIFDGFNVKKNSGENLLNVAIALEEIKNVVAGISKEDFSFLTEVSNLTSQAEALRNLSNILQSSRGRIREAQQQVQQASENNTDDSQHRNNNSDAMRRRVGNLNDSFELIHADESVLNLSAYREAETAVAELNTRLEQNEAITIDDINATKRLVDEYKNLAKAGVAVDSIENDLVGATKAANDFASNFGTIIKQGVFSDPNEYGISNLVTEVRTAEGEILKFKGTYNGSMVSMRNTTNQVKTELTGISKVIGAFKSKFHDLMLYWSANFFNPQKAIDIAEQGVDIIHDLDDALTEMQKVSDESIGSLKKYQKESFKTADDVGSTALDLQRSTASWQRLGEALNEAKKSAETTTILKNVSEFSNIDDAAESLVSISQAYKELDKIDIVDIVNNIGNNYSVATDKLSEGLKDAGAVLKTQGNDLYKSVALLTAANAVPQNMSKASGGVRTIALRIAGTSEAEDELKSLGEDVDDFVVQTEAKKRKIIKDYTAVASNDFKGVDILNKNGNLRDTYDILLDVSKIYKEIQATDKKLGTNRAQALVEELAGKQRSNIAASILENPEMLESVYKSALNSAGSAQHELNAYLDSISGHIEKLKNQWQSLWASDNSREIINFFVDLGSGILKVVDDVGLLKTAIVGIATTTAFKNKGRDNMFSLSVKMPLAI